MGLLITTCSAFIAPTPFVVAPSSIIVGRQLRTLPKSSGIIVSSFRVRLGSGGRSHSHP